MNTVLRYVMNILILLDQALNTLAAGSPNETISERAAKARDKGKQWGCVLCKFLGWVNPGHCDNALKSTIGDDAIIKD